ncbi:MAG TPA: hypothetical protein VMG62_02410, partial [Solirubrobacteraceae bacterium]|nr:hypothetical protein [Solirubrobacteraceae bacterium]
MSRLDTSIRECPWIGLDFYDELDGPWFFGRDRERSRIITNLRASRLTLLHADSGIGKSSLLRAGVAWRLRQLALDSDRGDMRDVPVVFSSWKDDPLPGLIEAIAVALEPLLEGRPAPALPREHLDEAVARAAGAAHAKPLLILDQFEEYLLYSPRERHPGRFADELARCVNRSDLPVNVLIAIREDAYAGLGDLFKARIGNVYGNFLHVEHLDAKAGEEAIRKPLAVYNAQRGTAPVQIEDALIRAVLEQVRAPEGGISTPVLQLVMESIWAREREAGSHVLRLSTLRELAGVQQILDVHLDSALAGFSPAEREIATDAFDRLVTDSGGKIAQTVPDLAHRTHHSEQRVEAVMERLLKERILRSVQAPPGRDPTRFRRYEIFHDVLAPALNRVVANREEQRLEREKRKAELEARLERERAQKLRVRALVAWGLLALALIAFVIAAVAYKSAHQHEHEARSVADAASAEGELAGEPRAATRLALRALATSPTPQAQHALRASLASLNLARTLTSPPPAVAVAYSPDGRLIATGAASGPVRLWEATGHHLKATLGFAGLAPLRTAAFSPDARLLLTGYGDGTVRLWNLHHASPAGEAIVVSHGSPIASAEFNPAGSRFLTAGADGQVRVFDTASRRQVGVLRVGREVRDAAWSPDGRSIAAVVGGDYVEVWNAATGRRESPPIGNAGQSINSVRFDPREPRELLTAEGGGTARVYRIPVNRPLLTFTLPSAEITSAAFDPSGRRVLTGDTEGELAVWSTAPGATAPLSRAWPGMAHATVDAVAFSPDGDQVAAATADGATTIAPLHGSDPPVSLPGPATGDQVSSAAFDAAGELVLTGSLDGGVRVWNAAAGRPLVVLAMPHGEAVDAVTFSPDGHYFASVTHGGHAYVFHTQDGRFFTQISTPAPIANLAFAPTGPTVALTTETGHGAPAEAGGVVRVWRWPPQGYRYEEAARYLLPRGHTLTDAAFGPGQRVAISETVAERIGRVHIWSWR